ncbi:16S rRNA (cytosine(1402)-N(4))-methyltransferase [archaeon]|nr:MAG: 16S rRNA (cytosine(1402)-N(4))-methyltransferase [archaeon]
MTTQMGARALRPLTPSHANLQNTAATKQPSRRVPAPRRCTSCARVPAQHTAYLPPPMHRFCTGTVQRAGRACLPARRPSSFCKSSPSTVTPPLTLRFPCGAARQASAGAHHVSARPHVTVYLRCMSDAPSTAVPFVHVTVLKEAASTAIVSSPAVRAGETGSAPPADIVDCTLGGGGHTLRMCELTRAARVIGLDLDAAAIAAAGARLESAGFAGRTRLLHTSYVHVGDAIARAGNPVHGGLVQGVVADLGVSSFQLDTGARGFSFRLEGPLDMRFDDTRRDTPTAADLVNKLPQGTLTHIFKVLGEEACAPQVASAIVARRAMTPFTTTRDLAGVIGDCIRRTKQQRAKHGSARGSSAGDGSASSKHPATKCFQALRIAVNRELEAVEVSRARPRAQRVVVCVCVRARGLPFCVCLSALHDTPSVYVASHEYERACTLGEGKL